MLISFEMIVSLFLMEDASAVTFPIAVSSPVLMTMPEPEPSTTNVDMKTMFLVSSGLLSSKPGLLQIKLLSPVKIELSTFRPNAVRIRISAGMTSPSKNSMMSPGTSWSAWIIFFIPSCNVSTC